MSTKASLRAAVVAAMSVAGLVAGAAPASAGSSCSVIGCSTTVNRSTVGAHAYRNWCWGGDSTGDAREQFPNCSSGGVAQQGMHLSSGGGRTPSGQDWDTFRVDGGWCYKVHFAVDFAPDFTKRYDRRGRGSVYVKVGDEALATIQAQSTSSCP